MRQACLKGWPSDRNAKQNPHKASVNEDAEAHLLSLRENIPGQRRGEREVDFLS